MILNIGDSPMTSIAFSYAIAKSAGIEVEVKAKKLRAIFGYGGYGAHKEFSPRYDKESFLAIMERERIGVTPTGDRKWLAVCPAAHGMPEGRAESEYLVSAVFQAMLGRLGGTVELPEKVADLHKKEIEAQKLRDEEWDKSPPSHADLVALGVFDGR